MREPGARNTGRAGAFSSHARAKVRGPRQCRKTPLEIGLSREIYRAGKGKTIVVLPGKGAGARPSWEASRETGPEVKERGNGGPNRSVEDRPDRPVPEGPSTPRVSRGGGYGRGNSVVQRTARPYTAPFHEKEQGVKDMECWGEKVMKGRKKGLCGAGKGGDHAARGADRARTNLRQTAKGEGGRSKCVLKKKKILRNKPTFRSPYGPKLFRYAWGKIPKSSGTHGREKGAGPIRREITSRGENAGSLQNYGGPEYLESEGLSYY